MQKLKRTMAPAASAAPTMESVLELNGLGNALDENEQPSLPLELNEIPNVEEVWNDHYGQYIIMEAIKADRPYNETRKLIEAYYRKLQADATKTKDLYNQFSKQRAENSYFDKQRNYNHLPVLPPTDFASEPQIDNGTSRIKYKDVLSYFPKESFSGIDNGKSLKIENFLNQCTRAQKRFKLEESEFLFALEKSCTGNAAETVSNLIHSGYSTPEVYEKLLSLYGTSMRPAEAMTKLLNFTMPPGTKNLNSLIREIEKLAIFASNTTSSQALRVKNRNNLSIEALTRCLPPHSRILLQDKLNGLRSELEEIRSIKEARGEKLLPHEEETLPSFTAVCRALTSLQPVVDEEIEAYATKIGGRDRPSQVDTLGSKSRDKRNRQVYNQQDKFKPQNVFAVKHDACQFQPRVFELRNENKNYGASSPYSVSKGKLFCTLCGGNNHLAAQGCRAIRSDEGVILQPTYGNSYCDKCHDAYDVQLNHMPKHCPARPAMIEMYKSGKAQPQGIYAQHFSHLVKRSSNRSQGNFQGKKRENYGRGSNSFKGRNGRNKNQD